MRPFRFIAFHLLLYCPAFTQLAPSHGKKMPGAKPVPAWEAIHESAVIIDTHADTPQRFLDENFDLSQDTPVTDGHIDFGKIKKGNLGAEFFSIWVEPEFK